MVYSFNPGEVNKCCNLPLGDKYSTPPITYLKARVFFALVVKITSPVPSPYGFAASAPRISTLKSISYGTIISPKS